MFPPTIINLYSTHSEVLRPTGIILKQSSASLPVTVKTVLLKHSLPKQLLPICILRKQLLSHLQALYQKKILLQGFFFCLSFSLANTFSALFQKALPPILPPDRFLSAFHLSQSTEYSFLEQAKPKVKNSSNLNLKNKCTQHEVGGRYGSCSHKLCECTVLAGFTLRSKYLPHHFPQGSQTAEKKVNNLYNPISLVTKHQR